MKEPALAREMCAKAWWGDAGACHIGGWWWVGDVNIEYSHIRKQFIPCLLISVRSAILEFIDQ